MKNMRQMILSLMVMLTLLFSSFGAINVYADDAAPVPEATEEAIVEEGSPEAPPEAQATEEAPADPTEEVGETEPVPTEAAGEEGEEASDSTEEPTGEPTEEATGEAEPTEEPTAEPTPMLPDEELDTLPEILENVPAGTEIIILDADGNIESLASEEAAETMVEGDPVWCPTGRVPGDAECTPSFTSFSALIAELSSGSYSGAGTIYVAFNYNPVSDTDQILFNGSATYDAVTNPNPLNNLGDLTIQGGWDGNTGGTNITATPSTIGVSMSFINWVTNLTFNDLVFTNTTDNVGFGLSVNTTGTVTMDTVSANDSTGSNSGAIIHADAGISVADSFFNGNGGDGLLAYSSAGHINITNVNAGDNAATGILADTCNWDSATQSCTGTGNVTISGSTIGGFGDGNGTYGLRIASGGSTTLTGVNSTHNSLSGLLLENLASGTAGTVTVFGGVFNNNTGGAGIRIYQYANGNITLNNVQTVSNRYGAIIDNTIGTGSVIINESIFAGSTNTGLHVDSNGNIQLTRVEAGSGTYTGNGSNGAYLISDGDIIIDTGSFNENVNSNFPADPGVFAKAGGNITFLDVTANNNAYGPGAVLKTTGTGDIWVSGTSVFNNNGSFGLQATVTDGTIDLDGVTANLNAVKGAYLNAYGLSDIDIDGGFFNQNGSYGMYATTSEGNIDINGAMFDGNDIGAKLIASNSSDIILDGVTFQNNEIGAYLVGKANMTLTDIVADANTAYGVKLFSTFTQKGCYCAGDENTSINATINNGAFTNSPVGVYAKPGDEGSVTFTGTQDYAGTTDPYILDTDAIPLCSDCGCDKPKDEKGEGKTYNVIEVPFSGSGNVPQQCDIYAGTIMQMENGVVVKVRCPFEGFSNLQGVNFTDLPGVLDEDMFELGILFGLLGEDGSFILNSDGTITLTFTIPETARGRAQQLLFWDTEMNDGEGGWVEMPPFEYGTSFMLHPENTDDPRMIVSGVVNNGNTMSITVNFAGYFVVVGQ